MHSAIATGRVWHQRFEPRRHRFSYRTSYALFDIDRVRELSARSRLWSVERFNLVSYRRKDCLDPTDRLLRQAVIERVAAVTGRHPGGSIFLLTHLRQWGVCFNPVSFYFCHDSSGWLESIVAEVHNTPWNQRHAYVLDCRDQAGPDYRFKFDKAFHVSPFMPMDIGYDWRFRIEPDHLDVHMHLKRSNRKCFTAGMRLALEPMTTSSMRRMPLRFPLMTLKVVGAIYWQALRLWLKRIPFYAHPDKVKQ